MGILAANGLIAGSELEKTGVAGELSLDGAVRPVHAVVSWLLHFKDSSYANELWRNHLYGSRPTARKP